MNDNITSQEVALPPSESGFENPGIEPHIPRQSDSDPKKAKRREWEIVLLLTVSIIGAIVAVAGFFVFPAGDTQSSIRIGHTVIGVGLGLAILGIGLAVVHWGKTLMNDKERVEQRHPRVSSPEQRAEVVADLEDVVADSNLARRPVLKGALITAAALAPLPAVVPLVGGMTPEWTIEPFRHTAWRIPSPGEEGRLLATDPDNRLIPAASVTNGSVFHVIPHDLGELEGEDHFMNELAKAVVILVRIDPSELKIAPGKEDWNFHGIIAYSKVCTHVGCPVALYEQTTKHLLCPCHQSTFDLADGARVVFGPAKRPLPQLPITVNADGYLMARSDFDEPVGPSFWERKK